MRPHFLENDANSKRWAALWAEFELHLSRDAVRTLKEGHHEIKLLGTVHNTDSYFGHTTLHVHDSFVEAGIKPPYSDWRNDQITLYIIHYLLGLSIISAKKIILRKKPEILDEDCYNARIMPLDAQIEGVLFYEAEPMKIAALAKFFEVSEEEVRTSLKALEERLQAGAIRLILTDTEAVLATTPELSETIEKLRRDDLKKDIGKAGAETLAIILYRGPLSRAEIDRIRGVNSTFIIRNLLIRGLVEKRNNPKDSRSFYYAATPELLQHIGITRREDLPEFEEIVNTLETFEQEQKELEEGKSDTVFASAQ